MNKVPDLISNAKRKNQAYQQYYGPEAKITNAITRDMSADHVIARRSWFPTIATAEYFSSPPSMTKHRNINMTKGRDLKNIDSYRQRAKPGTLATNVQWNNPDSLSVMDDPQSSHTFLYIIVIVLAVVLFTTLF